MVKSFEISISYGIAMANTVEKKSSQPENSTFLFFGIELVPILRDGTLSAAIAQRMEPLPPPVKQLCLQTRDSVYAVSGFEFPWVAYLAFEKEICVGTCAFKTPPKNNEVEIAYFSFPGNEGRGLGTEMARSLLEIAGTFAPFPHVGAQTLPKIDASTRILEKLGFFQHGSAQDPDVGRVWVWQRPSAR
jgi:[ribosomal protein S5]-alanine N-acetyltransferase